MANTKKLDVVILGLLCHEELSGYDIKQRLDTRLSMFWGASFGSIYPTLKELEERKFLISFEKEDQKRKKIIYTITEAGRDYLKEWLEQPVEKDELRYETLLKVFFAGESNTDVLLQHILSFQKKSQQQLQILKLMEAELRNIPPTYKEKEHGFYLLTMEFGIITYEGYLKWCESAIEKLK